MVPNYLSFFTKENPLILASKSPQRSRILEMMEIEFLSVESGFEELTGEVISPEETAEVFARGKAEAVFKNHPNSIVVGVDTLVVDIRGQILGKPINEEDARMMILRKSDQVETVISGICLISPKKKLLRHETAKIYFSQFTEEDVERIVKLREWEKKSGGISVEGKSSIYIEKVEGNFWNIVGFPIPTFLKMLKEIME